MPFDVADPPALGSPLGLPTGKGCSRAGSARPAAARPPARPSQTARPHYGIEDHIQAVRWPLGLVESARLCRRRRSFSTACSSEPKSLAASSSASSARLRARADAANNSDRDRPDSRAARSPAATAPARCRHAAAERRTGFPACRPAASRPARNVRAGSAGGSKNCLARWAISSASQANNSRLGTQRLALRPAPAGDQFQPPRGRQQVQRIIVAGVAAIVVFQPKRPRNRSGRNRSALPDARHDPFVHPGHDHGRPRRPAAAPTSPAPRPLRPAPAAAIARSPSARRPTATPRRRRPAAPGLRAVADAESLPGTRFGGRLPTPPDRPRPPGSSCRSAVDSAQQLENRLGPSAASGRLLPASIVDQLLDAPADRERLGRAPTAAVCRSPAHHGRSRPATARRKNDRATTDSRPARPGPAATPTSGCRARAASALNRPRSR